MKYYEIKNITENTADLYIYGVITPYPWDDSEISAQDFKSELDKVKGKDLNIYVNSPGGSVFEGQAISAMLERHEGKKVCYIDGLCASIATKIPLASDEVYFAKGAYFMIHNAWSYGVGNKEELRKTADTLEKIDEGLVISYMTKSKISEEEIKQKMKDETWYTSADIGNDFDFNIIEGQKIAACLDKELFKNYKNLPEGLIPKVGISEKPENKISKITLELGLL